MIGVEVEDRIERPVYSALCDLCKIHGFKLRLVVDEKRDTWHITIFRDTTRFLNCVVDPQDVEFTAQSIIETFKEKKLWQ